METGREVEWTSETNYHFRLSAFRTPLLEFYEKNPSFIVPPSRMAEVVQSVALGLKDLSVSRPVERLSWGIRVPGDETQTIYVWLDALINYLTAAGFPFAPGKESEGGWPPDCQVIGKDIVRFHCVYWPAFLLALDLPLPKQILTHAHWTMGREKMSKTTGNVVDPFQAIERFGVDTMRYYLAHDGGIQDDADYENAFIVDRYKKDLRGGLGNLVSRIWLGPRFDVRRSVERAMGETTTPFDFKLLRNFGAEFRSDLASALDVAPDNPELQHVLRLNDLATVVTQHFDRLDSRKALHEIMTVIYMTNGYMQLKAPWTIVTDEDKVLSPQEAAELDSIIYLCAESVRICGILLQPYMPTKMTQLLDMLGVKAHARTLQDAQVGTDSDYGRKSMTQQKMLFPPLAADR